LPTGNVGGYGGCAADCKFSERCGDGTVQADEQCDDGQNRSAYGGCGPGCKLAPSCGDGMVQAARGEQCDHGTSMNTGAYGGCTMDCKKAARCGDKVVDAANGETCDDGNLNDYDGCSSSCSYDMVI
jgi:cysteine-rich repeat protein